MPLLGKLERQLGTDRAAADDHHARAEVLHMPDSLGKPHNDGRIDTRNGRHKRLGAHGDDERIGRHLLHKSTVHLAPKAHVKHARALEPGNLVLEIVQVASDILLVGFLGDKPHIAAHAIGALREHHLVTARAGCDRRHAAGRAGTHHEHALRNLRGLHRARNKILVGKARVHAAATFQRSVEMW